jgi:hypothetical protein
MPAVQYRLFFNNQPAKREELDRFDEITVSQEMDMAWEAQFQIPLCTDDKGRWSGERENFLADFKRVRVEIKIGDAPFVALIDGPIVGRERQLNSEPGRSMLTLRSQDDSYYLNQTEENFRFERSRDDEIAAQLFDQFRQVIKDKKIDKTPAPLRTPIPDVVQRGTAMQLLRFLAERQGFNAYVLPGQKPGQSVGYFKELPTKTDGLPPLILLGSDRNIFDFNPSHDAQRPSRFIAYTLGFTDQNITRSESDLSRVPRLGQSSTVRESDTAVQILRPRHGDAVDLDRWVAAETLRASYAISATGNAIADCYAGVLSPYRLIAVRGANTSENGTYLISRVTHHLTRSLYSQDFTLRRNGQSEAAPANNNSGLPLASAILAVSFNVQGRIF